ncbi:Ankyrin repeat [Lasiodiplodia hormozganensis]|uniref:Ankyrin repeat n=1 Tax=Lasiodiplodia hormozganensis TaxID=869390 RepID=A0AA39X1J3_9PEZI|nr:Ankyrin repeat [Lasiodiplodia hormozganensis]
MWRSTPHQKAILEACASQPLSTVLSLLSTCPDPPPDAKDMADEAATHGNAPVLSHLVCSGAIQFKGFLLYYSAAAHSRECVEIMLDRGGCDINDREDRIGNVLVWALGRRGCPDAFIEWLLARGARAERNYGYANEEHMPEYGYCLERAVARGSVAIMRMLVAHGAEVDASRALHTAVAMGYVDKVQFLVEEAGANLFVARVHS